MLALYVFLTITALIGYTDCFGQKTDDSKIIITLPNNTEVYKKVKIALVNNEFIVKDNYNYDTLTTYAREGYKFQGNVIARAIIKGNQVVLEGYYGLKQRDGFGYTVNPKNYKQVTYYKGENSWKLLMFVAEMIGGEISYSQ